MMEDSTLDEVASVIEDILADISRDEKLNEGSYLCETKSSYGAHRSLATRSADDDKNILNASSYHHKPKTFDSAISENEMHIKPSDEISFIKSGPRYCNVEHELKPDVFICEDTEICEDRIPTPDFVAKLPENDEPMGQEDVENEVGEVNGLAEDGTPSGSGLEDEEYERDETEAPCRRVTRSAVEPSVSERTHAAASRLPTNLEIREGTDYQCPVETLEDWDEGDENAEYEPVDREICVWKPSDTIDSVDLNDYLSIALGVYSIYQDQAMFILYTCDYKIEEAKQQLARRTVIKEKWSDDDTSLMKQAFQAFGKNFAKIRQMIPHKSMREIVNFYYDNKKKLDLRSLIDSLLEEKGPDVSDSEDDSGESEKDENTFGGECENCGNVVAKLKEGDGMKLCNACLIYFKNFHRHRPCTKSFIQRTGINRMNIKCPLDMCEIVDTFLEFAKVDEDAQLEENKKMDTCDDSKDLEIVRPPKLMYERKLQEVEKEQMMTRGNCVRLEHALRLQYNQFLGEGIDKYRLAAQAVASGRPRYPHTWTFKEKWQALYAFQRYGKDFEAVAELLGTKTADMVKSFYQDIAEQIDELILKAKRYYEKKVNEYNFDSELKIDPPKAEIVDLD